MMDRATGRFRLGQAIEYAEESRSDLIPNASMKVCEAITLMQEAARIEREDQLEGLVEDDDPD
jgi:vacuolar-type H+-ATPase subunit H